MKGKTWTYPRSIVIKNSKDEIVINVLTQLYQIGIYVAIYYGKNSMPSQLSLQPSDMKKLVRSFSKENLKDKEAVVEYSSEITVGIDEDGFYKEIK